MKKELRYLFSLVFLLVLLFPLRGLLADLPSLPISGEEVDYGEAYSEVDAVKRVDQTLAKRLKEALCERFSLSEREVFTVWEKGHLSVQVKKKPGVLPGDIRFYLKNVFGVEAEVKVFE